MSNAQAKLEVMKQWNPKTLAARVPAWARYRPFIQQDGHRAWVFKRFLNQPIHKMTAREYIEAFERTNALKPGAH